MAEPHEHDLSPGTILEDRWRVEGLLGRGGFATVYHATHVKLDKPAAVKVLDVQAPPKEMERFHERFLREAKLSAQVEHPNVVQILDYGVLDLGQNYAQPFIVMEMLRGRDLEEELLEHGPLEPERAWRLFDQALDALRVSHAMGIVHKDLKPSNLFISRVGEENERLVVVDFGIARAYDDPESKLTATNQFTGTPAYLAPEYIEQQDISPAVDVYQMGLIVAETLSGTPVVQASTPLSYLMAHCNGQQRIPANLDGTPLGDVLTQAVQVDPSARHADAGVLRDALAEIDWSLVPTADAPPVATRAQATNPLPPPGVGVDAFASTAAAMDTPAAAHELPAFTEPTPAVGHSRGRYVAALAAVAVLVAGGVAAFALGNVSEDDSSSPTAVATTDAPADEATDAPEVATPTPKDGAEDEATAKADPDTPASDAPATTPSTEDPVVVAADAPDAVADGAATDGEKADGAKADGTTHAKTKASGAPPAVAALKSSSPPTKKKKTKVVIKERLDLLMAYPEYDKIKDAYSAYFSLSAQPMQEHTSSLKALSRYGMDQPGRVADSFNDVGRTWRSGKRALTATKSGPIKNSRLDAAANAMIPIVDRMAKLAEVTYTYRTKTEWEADPGRLKTLLDDKKAVMRTFEPKRDAFVRELHGYEQNLLRKRFGQAHPATSPIVHHWYGALLYTSLAVSTLDANPSSKEYRKHVRKAKGHLKHIDSFTAIDLKAKFGADSPYEARNAIHSSVKKTKSIFKRLDEYHAAHATAQSKKDADSRAKAARANHYIVMAYRSYIHTAFDLPK